MEDTHDAPLHHAHPGPGPARAQPPSRAGGDLAVFTVQKKGRFITLDARARGGRLRQGDVGGPPTYPPFGTPARLETYDSAGVLQLTAYGSAGHVCMIESDAYGWRVIEAWGGWHCE